MVYNLAIPVGSVAVYINARPCGWCTAFRIEKATPHQEIRGIDSILPMEQGVGIVQVRGSLSVLRVRNSGGIEAAGMTALDESLSISKYFSLTLMDMLTQTPLFKSDMCVVTGQSWEGAARNTVNGQISFTATGMSNDFEG